VEPFATTRDELNRQRVLPTKASSVVNDSPFHSTIRRRTGATVFHPSSTNTPIPAKRRKYALASVAVLAIVAVQAALIVARARP
jgi:hypothetical protein